MAEGDKELAREEAFKKYNAAITAAGSLAAKESYNERVQIQLTEIARLASLSKTYNASATAALLLESSELAMIDRVSKAQAAADAKRLASLNQYMDTLNGKTGGSGLPTATERNLIFGTTPSSVPTATERNLIFGTTPSSQSLSEMPKLTNPSSNFMYDPLWKSVTPAANITINAGIGDPEAIARAVEDVLNQSTYRGTTVNRGAGQYYV
jgi:hypothetical protein